MLKLEKCKRALAVVLAVIMISAATVAGISLFSADKSTDDVLGTTEFQTVKLSAAASSATSDVIQVTAEQNEVNKITISGEVDSGFTGVVAIRIGSEAFKQLFDVSGVFNDTFDLNATFCRELNNVLPVYACYTDNTGYKELLIGEIGVITYDYDSGILGYPSGTTYISTSGQKSLTASYVPTDAAKDADGNVTLIFDKKPYVFKPNTTPVASTPEKGQNEGVYDQVGVDSDDDGNIDYVVALLNTVSGREYAVSELVGGASVGNGYGIPDDAWVDCTEAKDQIKLTPGKRYSFWVRNPGVPGSILPSAPVFLGSVMAIDLADAQTKTEFLAEYAAMVDAGKEIYPKTVTATSVQLAKLIDLYNKLPDDMKAHNDIAPKAKYLVLSEYLAKHQDLIAVAAKADKFTLDAAAENAVKDFAKIKTELAKHLTNDTDGKFVFELKKTVEKLDALIKAGATLDDQFAAAQFALDQVYSGAAVNSENYNANRADVIKNYTVDYEVALWLEKTLKEISSIEEASKLTVTRLEEEFEALKAVNTYAEFGEQQKLDISGIIYQLISDKYIAQLKEIPTNGEDAATVAIINDAIAKITANKASSNTSDPYTLTAPSKTYALTDEAVKVRAKYLEGLGVIYSFATGNEDIANTLNGYKVQLDAYLGKETDVYNDVLDGQTVITAINKIIDEVSKEANFKKAYYDAISYIEGLKNGKVNVDKAADEAIDGLKMVYAKYDHENADTLTNAVAQIIVYAEKENAFERKVNSSKTELKGAVDSLKATGNYTADGVKELHDKLISAYTAINALEFADGATTADIDMIVLEAVKALKTVNIYSVTIGERGEELSGTVSNENGIISALDVKVIKSNTKTELVGTSGVVVTGSYTDKKATALIDKKVVLFDVKLELSGLNDAQKELINKNGTYTVTVLIPKEFRNEKNIQVVSEGGNTTYIYDTVRAGAYLSFTVNNLEDQYHIVADKLVNLLWLVVALAVLLVAEIAVIIYFIIKRKKGTTLAAFAPIFAAAVMPTSVLAAVIALGTLSFIGAIAATSLVMSTPKKNNKAPEEASASSAPEITEPAPAVEEPVQEVAEAPAFVEEVTKEPASEVAEEAVEEPVVEAVPEVAEEPTPQTVEDITEEAIPEVIEELVEEPVAEAVEEPVAEAAEESAPEIVEEVILPIAAVENAEEDAEEDAEEEIIDTVEEQETKTETVANGIKVFVTYDYSFRAKLMLSSEEVQSRYALISDTLLSYGMKCRESWKKERYFLKGKTYANLTFRGKTLCVYLAIAPESLEGTKYFYENVSSVKKYESIPVLVRVRSARGCKYVIELIKKMFGEADIAQKRDVVSSFEYRTATIEELIDMGFIKLLMTDTKGEAVEVPEDTTLSLEIKEPEPMPVPVHKVVTVQEAAAVPDEKVEQFIKTEEQAVVGRRKGIVNIDTISGAFKDGETVTLQELKAKKLLPKNIEIVKILARGTLDKALTVKANDFSMDAAKMIIMAGGNVVRIKTKK